MGDFADYCLQTGMGHERAVDPDVEEAEGAAGPALEAVVERERFGVGPQREAHAGGSKRLLVEVVVPRLAVRGGLAGGEAAERPFAALLRRFDRPADELGGAQGHPIDFS